MRRTIVAAILVALCWLTGAAIVRVGLDAVDRMPYSRTSEILYLVIAAIALTVALSGSAVVIGRFAKTHRR